VKSKQAVNAAGLTLWIAVLDSGDEAVETLTGFAKAMHIESASLVAVGAFESATVGYFEWDKKTYKPIEISQQAEVLSFIGDVVRDDKEEPSLHVHTVLGLPDGTTRGGHLLKGIVRPTLEVIFTQTPVHLIRRKDPKIGIPLIDLDGH
jgi:hypothetical protein